MALIDFTELAIGGVLIIPLVLGWVEATKNLGVSGKWLFVEALVFGTLFAGLWQAINSGLIPEVALPWVYVVVVGLGGGVATTGLYDGVKKITESAKDYVAGLASAVASINYKS